MSNKPSPFFTPIDDLPGARKCLKKLLELLGSADAETMRDFIDRRESHLQKIFENPPSECKDLEPFTVAVLKHRLQWDNKLMHARLIIKDSPSGIQEVVDGDGYKITFGNVNIVTQHADGSDWSHGVEFGSETKILINNNNTVTLNLHIHNKEIGIIPKDKFDLIPPKFPTVMVTEILEQVLNQPDDVIVIPNAQSSSSNTKHIIVLNRAIPLDFKAEIAYKPNETPKVYEGRISFMGYIDAAHGNLVLTMNEQYSTLKTD